MKMESVADMLTLSFTQREYSRRASPHRGTTVVAMCALKKS